MQLVAEKVEHVRYVVLNTFQRVPAPLSLCFLVTLGGHLYIFVPSYTQVAPRDAIWLTGAY